ATPWRSALEGISREVDVRAPLEPVRAALLLAAQAWVYVDGLGDPVPAGQGLAPAAGLAPDARFVASTARWLAEHSGDPGELLQRLRGELQHTGDGSERIALLWQIAAMEEHVFGDFTAAKRTMRQL